MRMGQAFFIYGFHHNGQARHVVACVLFSADEEGIYVNWIAVSREQFSAHCFGSTSNNKYFCSCGLGTFLMLLVQM